MLSALKANLDKYEAKFGKVTEAAEPPKPQMGFHPPSAQEGELPHPRFYLFPPTTPMVGLKPFLATPL